ncbi:hypothetical protein PR048_028740 [Dryococelus australis]|uniref:Uncharacterized protein n=1 Tax=Dryococelus australis TaxID=614101 RepID=A0ABQ9GC16_9NEOP|nr:hypothetical protein PR048_028740 [Dryococelus australis]
MAAALGPPSRGFTASVPCGKRGGHFRRRGGFSQGTPISPVAHAFRLYSIRVPVHVAVQGRWTYTGTASKARHSMDVTPGRSGRSGAWKWTSRLARASASSVDGRGPLPVWKKSGRASFATLWKTCRSISDDIRPRNLMFPQSIPVPTMSWINYGLKSAHFTVNGATVAERLDCSPSVKAKWVQSPAGSLQIFASRDIVPDDATDRRVFSGISHFPRFFNSTLLHAHLTSPLSALKTSTLRGLCSCASKVKKRGSDTGDINNARLVPLRSYAQGVQCFRSNALLTNCNRRSDKDRVSRTGSTQARGNNGETSRRLFETPSARKRLVDGFEKCSLHREQPLGSSCRNVATDAGSGRGAVNEAELPGVRSISAIAARRRRRVPVGLGERTTLRHRVSVTLAHAPRVTALVVLCAGPAAGERDAATTRARARLSLCWEERQKEENKGRRMKEEEG